MRLSRLATKQLAIHSALLGCGIAMCAVTFAIAQGTLLQRLPWPAAERLLWLGAESKSGDASGFGLVEYDEMVTRVAGLEAAAPYMLASGTARTQAGTERVAISRVGGSFFSVLGIRPVTGRPLNSRDDRVGAELVVVLSEAFWKRLQHEMGDPLGSVLILDERPFRVVGVLSQAVAYPATADAWVPMEPVAGSLLRSTNAPFLHAVGRARTQDGIAGISAQLAAIPRARGDRSEVAGRFMAEPLRDHLVRDIRTAVLLFAGASAVLLAIACLAAATIQLAGRDRREREIAIRSTLGASPARLWRAVLVEAAGTALAAAALGLALSGTALQLGRTWGATTLPELLAVQLDSTIYVAAAGIAFIAALVVVGLPMASLLRSNAADLLRRTGNTTSSSASSATFRDTLIGMSVGVTLTLVIAFAVAAETLVGLLRVETGFVTKEIVAGTVRLPWQIVTSAEASRIRAFVSAFSRSVAEVNKAEVAISTNVPGKGNQSVISVQRSGAAGEIQTGMSQVSGNYFSLVGIPLRAGRTFGRTDTEKSPRVVIVDQDLARRLYGQASSIGQMITVVQFGSETAEIIGVVGAVRQAGRLVEPLPQIYLPIEQLPLSTLAVLARASSPEAVREVWKAAARNANPSAAIGEIVRLDDAVYGEMRRPKFYAVVLLTFALVAMAVSGAAVYASVAALVSQRSKEIGIRMALGAPRARVVTLVLDRVSRMTALGSFAGAICAYSAIRILESSIGPLGRPTALSLVGSVCVLWCAAGLAVWFPVWRATRISPIVALKD